MKPEKKFLIIGTGRSGTAFMARWFQANGFDVGHERDGQHGRSDWKGPMLDWWNYRNIFHVIREPEACVESMHAKPFASVQSKIQGFMPVVFQNWTESEAKEFCCEFYWKWNALCASIAHVSVPLEMWNQFAVGAYRNVIKFEEQCNHGSGPALWKGPDFRDLRFYRHAVEVYDKFQQSGPRLIKALDDISRINQGPKKVVKSGHSEMEQTDTLAKCNTESVEK